MAGAARLDAERERLLLALFMWGPMFFDRTSLADLRARRRRRRDALDQGVFGCTSLLGCHDVCPKQLPLSTQIAFVRRKMVAMAFK